MLRSKIQATKGGLLVISKGVQMDRQIQREREGDKVVHARTGEGGKKGGREGGEEVLREETHPLCSGGRNGSVQSDTAIGVSTLIRNYSFDATMWIYKLFLGLVIISCSGKFGRKPFSLSLTSTTWAEPLRSGGNRSLL